MRKKQTTILYTLSVWVLLYFLNLSDICLFHQCGNTGYTTSVVLSEDELEKNYPTFGQDGREYTLLLKLKGAESGSSYQVRWVPVKQSSFEAPFNKFSAYRRGRPDPEAPPLDPSEIEILAIQIASNFTQQSGNFQLDLKSINGLADGQASEI